MTTTVELSRPWVSDGTATVPGDPTAPPAAAAHPLADITEHLRLHHGRDLLELMGTPDLHHAIHRFAHFAGTVGLVLVDHAH